MNAFERAVDPKKLREEDNRRQSLTYIELYCFLFNMVNF
jgi:hypothetical protein